MRIIVGLLANILVTLIIVHVILSYVMDRFHPVRRGVDSIVEPLLMPIRRALPPVAGLDFSPVVLIILIQIISNLLVNL